jgi:hypothetical protein
VPFWIVDCIMFNLLKHIVVRSITLVQQVYQWITYEMYVYHVYDRPDNIVKQSMAGRMDLLDLKEPRLKYI